MNWRTISLVLVAMASLWLGALVAQTPPVGAVPGALSNTPARGELPAVPPLKSPVDFFRELLAMNVEERQQALANRTPEAQRLIAAKLREYQALSPEQRELLLKVTELRFYLWPLMNLPPTNRAEQFKLIPPQDRKLIEEHLKEWDRLPPDQQKQFRDNQAAIQHLSQSPEKQAAIANRMQPAQREQLEQALQRWQKLSPDQQRAMTIRFNRFFELSSGEKERTLQTLSEPERRQIEKTLATFEHLSRSQRAQCVASFEKLARMNQEELQQFLKNAERWEQMTPTQRKAWRDLLYKISPPPPMPPEADSPRLPWPPTPQPAKIQPRQVVTNGGG